MAFDFGPPLQQVFDTLGEQASYLPFGGEQKDIIVLPSQPDVVSNFGPSRLQSSTLWLEVLTADIPAFAKGKDKIIFKGTTYIVQNARIKDSLKLVWQVDTCPEAGA